MKLDEISVVFEVEEVSILPRFLLAQFLFEGFVGLTEIVFAALILLRGTTGVRTRDATPGPFVGLK